MNPQHRFERRPAKPTLHPRRVVGGLRMQARAANAAGISSTQSAAGSTAPAVKNPIAPIDPAAPASPTGWNWASTRWMRLAEANAPGDQLAEGLEYARAGQTRSMEVGPGLITGRVQGRATSAYRTSLSLSTFTHDQWESVVNAINAQAKYGASILAGELPSNIEDLFAPQGLRLFPAAPGDLVPSCTCSVFTGRQQDMTAMPSSALANGDGPGAQTYHNTPTPWCKHVCCLMYLIAERLGNHPLLILSMRGMADADLVERLRQHRALAGLQRAGGTAPSGPTPVYLAHVPRPPNSPATLPLQEMATDFWAAPDPSALEQIDLHIAPPEVSHPLLRRLGPSPFSGAKFPLVGLLATCYDVISQAAIRDAASDPSV